MNWRRLFGRRLAGSMRLELPPEAVEPVARAMRYRAEWTCGCGAQLRIRARQPRGDGPSNFIAGPGGHAVRPEAIPLMVAGRPVPDRLLMPSESLTWNGLAEERGWKTEPAIVCPACQTGVSVAEFKAVRAQRA